MPIWCVSVTSYAGISAQNNEWIVKRANHKPCKPISLTLNNKKGGYALGCSVRGVDLLTTIVAYIKLRKKVAALTALQLGSGYFLIR